MKRTDTRFDLTRRSVLGGLGAIGIASAGAGLGTRAFFSDTETFADNKLVAGEFDLKVDYLNRYYDGSAGVREDPTTWPVTASHPDPYDVLPRSDFATEEEYRAQFVNDDDVEAALVDLQDVKPGDAGCLDFSLHLFDNPGYIWLYADDLVSAENGLTEPETKDPDELDGEVSGELEEELLVRIYYDDNHDCSYDEGEQVVFGPGVGGFTDETGDNPATLAAAFATMSRNNGLVPLDGDRSSPMAFDDGPTAEARDCFQNSETHYLTLEWWLPVDHANEIQTDSVSFEVGFYAEQCRHNDGSGMIPEYAMGTPGSGDFSQVSYAKALGMAAYAKAGSGRGEIQIHGDSGGVENTTLWGTNPGDTFPANTDVPFTAVIDPVAETASLTVNGVTVTDTDVTDGTANGDTTNDPEWSGGVPSTVDLAISAMSGSPTVVSRVSDVTIQGYAASPGAAVGQNDVAYVEFQAIPAVSPITVAGVIRFEGDATEFAGTDFVGIDWR